ncbi:uncharacterized protein VTP21DRAFT_3681 [Calcarisporiella thermophila]|uniref:uncharacterized protein n=1 Tax=Calcarisporiella thermophila TaxID=911321 RepID=UPI003743A4F4
MSDLNRGPCFPSKPMRSFGEAFFHPHSPPATSTQHVRPTHELRMTSPLKPQESSRGRKRRQSFDDEDVNMSSSSTKYSERDSPQPQSYTIKRTKMGGERTFSVSKLLATLDKPQLLSLLNNLMDAHPELQQEIPQYIPRPTLQSVTTHLAYLEKRVAEAYPYTKWGPGRDEYSFNRVKSALMELIEAIMDYADHFTSPQEFPTTKFAYLHLATSTAHRLPEWDNDAHNQIKRDTYSRLAEYWQRAVEDAADKAGREGKIYGQQIVSEWARNFVEHNQRSGGAFQTVVDNFAARLGWIIGGSEQLPDAGNPPGNGLRIESSVFWSTTPVFP